MKARINVSKDCFRMVLFHECVHEHERVESGIHESKDQRVEGFFQDEMFHERVHENEKMLQVSLKSIDPRVSSSSIEIPVETLIALTHKKEAAKCARKALKRKSTRSRAKAMKIQVRSACEEFSAELNVVDGNGSEDEKDVDGGQHGHRGLVDIGSGKHAPI